MSRPAISQHLKVLEDAELVSARKDGTRRLYRARPETVSALLDELGSMWDSSLTRLKQAAERDDWPERARAMNRSTTTTEQQEHDG